HGVDCAGDGMRLQADDDEILGWKLGGIVGAVRMNHALLIADQEFQPVGAHRGKMRSSRHQADICASARKLDPEISADGAGAVNADLHETTFQEAVVENRHKWSHVSESNFGARAIIDEEKKASG